MKEAEADVLLQQEVLSVGSDQEDVHVRLLLPLHATP